MFKRNIMEFIHTVKYNQKIAVKYKFQLESMKLLFWDINSLITVIMFKRRD